MDEPMIEVEHDDANTISFVGNPETGKVEMYLFEDGGEETTPVELVAEMTPSGASAMMENLSNARTNAEHGGQ